MTDIPPGATPAPQSAQPAQQPTTPAQEIVTTAPTRVLPHEHPHEHRRRWYKYPIVPFVWLVSMRPSASARHWFVWSSTTSIVHGLLILLFFTLADTLSDGVRAMLLQWWAVIGGFVTWVQIKSVGERPPAAELFDKWDNNTSYIPIAAWVVVWLVYLAFWGGSHFNPDLAYWGLDVTDILSMFPRSMPEIWPAFVASLLFALADAGLISVQYKLSRGVGRILPT